MKKIDQAENLPSFNLCDFSGSIDTSRLRTVTDIVWTSRRRPNLEDPGKFIVKTGGMISFAVFSEHPLTELMEKYGVQHPLQLPPVDISLIAVTKTGEASRVVLFGVEFTNETFGIGPTVLLEMKFKAKRVQSFKEVGWGFERVAEGEGLEPSDPEEVTA